MEKKITDKEGKQTNKQTEMSCSLSRIKLYTSMFLVINILLNISLILLILTEVHMHVEQAKSNVTFVKNFTFRQQSYIITSW